MQYSDRFLHAVSTSLEQNHIARTFAQKFVFRLFMNIYVDRFGTLALSIDI